jgi:hypothetical protein
VLAVAMQTVHLKTRGRSSSPNVCSVDILCKWTEQELSKYCIYVISVYCLPLMSKGRFAQMLFLPHWFCSMGNLSYNSLNFHRGCLSRKTCLLLSSKNCVSCVVITVYAAYFVPICLQSFFCLFVITSDAR